MRVLAIKPGHDGAVAYVADGTLIYSLEPEKDSYQRHAELNADTILWALTMAPEMPDVIAIGGWHKNLPDFYGSRGAGYFGVTTGSTYPATIFGQRVTVFHSTHERSHILAAVGMHPDGPLRECCVLVWEGVIGSLYHWADDGRRITPYEVLSQPGARYSALYALADPAFPDEGSDPRDEDPGKIMALAAYAEGQSDRAEIKPVLDQIIAEETFYPFDKSRYSGTALYNCGVQSQIFADAALMLGNLIYDIFERAAAKHLPAGLPLVISGGCGLNGDWNSRWSSNPQFISVFVPPCPNDSGSAIGTAIDAAWTLGQPAVMRWSVYAGIPFQHDAKHDDLAASGWTSRPLSLPDLAAAIQEQRVVAWARGRAEIGPRALGHRSLLASATSATMRDRLNTIKQRESFRPIAPVVTAAEADQVLAGKADSYMLYFTKVTVPHLPAVTHYDGSTRAQVVSAVQEPVLHELLTHVGALSGHEVLCNTSLNHKGYGFLNTLSDLVRFCEARGIGDIVADDVWLVRDSTHGQSCGTR